MTQIKNHQYFCLLPWMHLTILPSGDVLPCCRSDFNSPMGNVRQNSLNEIWNNPAYKKMREALLIDEKLNNCSNCHMIEANGGKSLRQKSNEYWAHLLNELNFISQSNNEIHFSPLYLDLRFNNICHFSCRTCSAEFSTGWYPETNNLQLENLRAKLLTIEEKERLWGELEAILPNVQQIYFAGGEPLQIKDHYKLLDKLISLNKRETGLTYNTNLSTLYFNKKNILTLWQQFKNIVVSVSVDGVGRSGEYIRKGFDWNLFIKNFKRVQLICPHVVLKIHWTHGVLNSIHILDAIKELVEKGILSDGNNFELNMLNEPRYLNIGILNKLEREHLIAKYNSFIENIIPTLNISNKDNLVNVLNEIINFLNKNQWQEFRNEFVAQTKYLDDLRSESMSECLPELSELMKTYSK